MQLNTMPSVRCKRGCVFSNFLAYYAFFLVWRISIEKNSLSFAPSRHNTVSIKWLRQIWKINESKVLFRLIDRIVVYSRFFSFFFCILIIFCTNSVQWMWMFFFYFLLPSPIYIWLENSFAMYILLFNFNSDALHLLIHWYWCIWYCPFATWSNLHNRNVLIANMYSLFNASTSECKRWIEISA